MRVAAVRCLTALIGLGLAASAGAQQTVTFTDFCNTSSFTLNGASGSLNPNPQCVLRLTNGFGPGSSAFLTNTFSLASNASFSTLFRFQILNPVGIGDSDGAGADGIVFAVQTVSNTAGGGGGGIGFQGISPSVGVELDTFNNGTQDQNDPNHIGIDTNGNMTSIALTHISPRFNDGGVWFAWVDYDGVAKVLQGRVNKTGVRPVNPDVSATVDAGDPRHKQRFRRVHLRHRRGRRHARDHLLAARRLLPAHRRRDSDPYRLRGGPDAVLPDAGVSRPGAGGGRAPLPEEIGSSKRATGFGARFSTEGAP